MFYSYNPSLTFSFFFSSFPGYAILLMAATHTESVEMHKRQVAAVTFKNMIKNNWGPSDDGSASKICQADRVNIKVRFFNFFFSTYKTPLTPSWNFTQSNFPFVLLPSPSSSRRTLETDVYAKIYFLLLSLPHLRRTSST